MTFYCTNAAQTYQRADVPRVLVKLVGGTHMGHSNIRSIAFNFDNLPCWFAADKLKDDGTIHFQADLKNRTPDTARVRQFASKKAVF